MSTYKNSKEGGVYHLGHLFMERMSSRAPDDICTIDAATGKKETYGSVLSRSVALAVSLRRAGLQPGDVLLLGSNRHLDIYIPHYSALLNGLPIICIYPYAKYDVIKAFFEQTTPKIVFCQQDTVDVYNRVAQDVGIDVKIVTFDDGECSLSTFLETYGGYEATDEFMPANFDTEKIYAWLVPTSGSTGPPKIAAFKHKDLIEKFLKFPEMLISSDDKTKLICDFFIVQWISSYLYAIHSTLIRQCTKLISNSDNTEDHIDVINKYRPALLGMNVTMLYRILRNDKYCDMTCFDEVGICGSKVSETLFTELKSRMRPDAVAVETYGLTETIGLVFVPNPNVPFGSCGVSTPDLPVKLVDFETGVEITQPNVTGELWVKGPCFTEYYNRPEETAKAFTEDGWFKTGDLFYRDENHFYYFEGRTRWLIKGNILPSEVEEVILRHRGVQEACVIDFYDAYDGQQIAACVVRNPGSEVTAQEIKDLVAENLSADKQLGGGVVFLDELPVTHTGKVAHSTLEQIVQRTHRE